MEDPFAYITKYSIISNSQAEFLHRRGFELQLQEISSASEATPLDPIIICSPPMDSMEEEEEVHQEDECYQTPEENFSIHDPDEQDGMRIDGVGGGDSSIAVDLGIDTDLLLSENGISTEIAEETENAHVFSGDVEMDDSPQLLGSDTSATHILDSVIPENSLREEAEKNLENGMSNASDAVEVQDKFEINDSNGVSGNLVARPPQHTRILPDWNVQFAQRVEGRGRLIGGRVDGLSSGREEQILTGAGSSSHGEEIGGEVNLAPVFGGLGRVGRRNRLNSGREEQILPGAGSSAPEREIPREANAQPAHVTGVARNSSGENSAQQFLKLSDLISVDDNDILVMAIKAGMKFPRPRWWRPEGYGRASSQSLN